MGSLSILIVEDETIVANDTKMSLERAGFSVAPIMASAAEALKCVELEKPDAALVDIHLRDKMDGIALARELQLRYRVPVVFLSAYAEDDLLARAREVGASAYLLKPFNERELKATLEMAISKARQDEAMRGLQKSKGLSVMAASVAHRFNNLLHAVLGNITFALSDLPDDTPVRELLERADSAAREAALISSQMLTYVGKSQAEMKLLDGSSLIEGMSEVLRLALPEKIEFIFNPGSEPLPFKGDPSQMRQVIMNLLTNCSEAIGNAVGSVTLTVGRTFYESATTESALPEDEIPAGKYVFYEIADTGCGMDSETLEHILDPFYTTKFIGRGMGMAVVLGILRAHRGSIAIRSKPGRGTTVRVFLPLSLEKEAPERAAPVSEKASLSGTILLVDDDENVRELSRKMLERIGFTVLLAGDGREAIEVFSENADSISCVVLDIGMPRMRGTETLRKLRSLNDDVRVILSSGYTQDLLENEFRDCPPDAFMRKPYAPSDLRRKLSEVLGPRDTLPA